MRRNCAAPRSCTSARRGRLDPAGALRRGRSTSAPRSSAARPSPTAQATATTSPRSRASPTRRARSASPTPTRRSERSTSMPTRSASTSSPAARSSTCSAPSGLGFLYVRAGLLPSAAAEPDRLVRRRGHLPDGHLRLLAGRRRAPLRRRHAAGAEHLRRRRGHVDHRGGRHGRDRGARRRPRHPADRRAEELGADRRHAARPRPPRPARLRPSTDVGALVDALAEENIVCSERDSNLRVSLHLYNVEEDVDRLLDALRENRSLLA